MAIRRIGIPQLYRDARPRGHVSQSDVLDFFAYDKTTANGHHASRMFSLQENSPARSTEKSLRLRRSAPGALRFKSSRENADARRAAFASRDDVALCGSAAVARARHARRRHDAGTP